MAPLTTAQVRALLHPPAAPCVSLYMPAHRSEPGRREDPIRYRNLVRQTEEELRASHPGSHVQGFMRKFQALDGDVGFWTGAQDGLAIFAAGDLFETFWLPRPVRESAIVADSFHIKPLLRIVQSADRFHVLSITRTESALWEGDRYGLRRVETAGVVPTFDEAVGTEVTQENRVKLTVGARTPATGHYSASGSRKDEIGVDTKRFLLRIDRAVTDKFSMPSGLPLVLAGLPENTSEFRKLSQNPHLVEGEVHGDPGAFGLDRLRSQAWKVLEPRYLTRLAQLTENFRTALAHGRGSRDPAAIAPAALDGRVWILLVDADKVVPGKVDRQARTVLAGRLDDTDGDDLLDDLAELVLNAGGEVVVVPSERMPTDTGAAAIYRF
jgi:hypothetical protein